MNYFLVWHTTLCCRTLLLKSYSFTHISISESLFLYTQYKFCVCACSYMYDVSYCMVGHRKYVTWSRFLIVYRAVTYKNYLPLNRLIHVPSDSNISSKEQLTSAFKGFLKKTYPGSLTIYNLLREIYNTRRKKQIWIIMETIYISTCIYYDIYMSSSIKGEVP